MKEFKYHIVTIIFLFIMHIVITFTAVSPLILCGQLVFFTIVIVSMKRFDIIKRDFLLFIPFFIITSVINVLFSSEGSNILFTILGKDVTLEALLYGCTFAFKLLIILLDFSALTLLLDTDKSVSFFSALMPKSTFMFMIIFKLFPYMKENLFNLRQVYVMRGVNFKEKKLVDRVKANIPLLTILLENSLEGAFDIGEAAQVRGFFSGKRSRYEKAKFSRLDAAAFISFLVIILFLYLSVNNLIIVITSILISLLSLLFIKL